MLEKGLGNKAVVYYVVTVGVGVEAGGTMVVEVRIEKVEVTNYASHTSWN